MQVIDNRNVAIPKKIIKKVGDFSSAMKVGSEDIEFGMRLFHAGVTIFYDPSIIAYHHERITLRSFLSQHFRIASSHAVLDHQFLKGPKISIINRKTWTQNLRSALELWIYYWTARRYKDVLALPLIYLLLATTRILGYVSI